ncbi:MAG: fibrillarin-like rRNA/tRNA 2'-O-methyltransferase [Candidatus Thermoplasmatota archaeon]
MALRKTDHAGVFTDGSWLYTRNLVPGVSVYGEGLSREGDAEYRRWDANRSKLAAYLKRGGRIWPFEATTSLLYLGAGSGTTVSHLSDICSRGSIMAIEVSPRSFRDLVTVAERRTNLLPLLGDASQPSTYRQHVEPVDVLYQDVAQRDQEGIFLKNVDFLRPGGTGFLIVKSRSTDVAAKPADVYARIERALSDWGLQVIDVRTLDPFETDHAAVVVRKRNPHG